MLLQRSCEYRDYDVLIKIKKRYGEQEHKAGGTTRQEKARTGEKQRASGGATKQLRELRTQCLEHVALTVNRAPRIDRQPRS